MKLVIAVFIGICLFVPLGMQGQKVAVIPYPESITEHAGEFRLQKGTIG